MNALTSPPMHASQAGETVERATYNAARACNTANAAEHALWDGYDAVARDPQTTADEKAVASLGTAVSRQTMNVQDHARIGYAFTNAIANGLSGPFGASLAGIIYTAASSASLANSAEAVIWRGYDALLGSSNLTANERAVASLGTTISQSTLPSQEHTRVGYSIIQSISCGSLEGRQGTVLANVSYRAAAGAQNADTANHVMWDGFAAIAASADATETQRTLANEALKVSHQTLPSQEHSRLAYQYMKSIETAG